MDRTAAGGDAGAASLSPTTPVGPRFDAPGPAPPKRKRSSAASQRADGDSSPGSPGAGDDDNAEPLLKRAPGVKRACNECRQQKLRCNVVSDPSFESCSRCRRLRLECKIETNFKRVGKRSKHAEMEREIERLRRRVQTAKTRGYLDDDDDDLQSPIVASAYSHTRNPSLMGSDEAVSSLLHLKRGGAYNPPRVAQELEEIRITDDDEYHLFRTFFDCFHQYLPFLNRDQPPDQFHRQHPLLYWSIVAVAARRHPPDPSLLSALSGPLTRLLWRTVGDVPSTHYVVKALCLLCTWPLPTSTSSSDPTHILCGVMMRTATGIGLHRPSHISDFSRVPVDLDKEQLHDRVTTWAVCNIVAQNIGTGYGQPASTLYDWTLATRPGEPGPFTLTPELEARLKIERFCDKVSKEMYSNVSDSRGVTGDEHRAILMRVYRREFSELQADILSRNLSHIVKTHLYAAGLHLRLAGFFDSSTTPTYMDDLMGLWRAAVGFLDAVFEQNSVDAQSPQPLHYSSNYMQQMLVAAGFALLKLLRSFLARTIDYERGRHLFNQTISAIRMSSVMNNDLNWRLAELMAQMWVGDGTDARRKQQQQQQQHYRDDGAAEVDDSLQLKVRCRHSMSLVFDSVWRWRENYQARGQAIDGKHPTTLDSTNVSSASSMMHQEATPVGSQAMAVPNMLAAPGPAAPTLNPTSAELGIAPNMMTGMYPENLDFMLAEPMINWTGLDGLIDFQQFQGPMMPVEGSV